MSQISQIKSPLEEERDHSHVKERIDVIASLPVDPVPRAAASQEKYLSGRGKMCRSAEAGVVSGGSNLERAQGYGITTEVLLVGGGNKTSFHTLVDMIIYVHLFYCW